MALVQIGTLSQKIGLNPSSLLFKDLGYVICFQKFIPYIKHLVISKYSIPIMQQIQINIDTNQKEKQNARLSRHEDWSNPRVQP